MSAEQRPWYEEFFASGDYVRYWLGGEDTPLIPAERTEREVAFLVEALTLPPGAPVLDLACGHGRHAIPLARRGYAVTGVDLAEYHLDMARRRAAEAGVHVEWVRADMREIPRGMDGRFDAVISMFTAFGYFDSDGEDQRVLEGVCRALRPGGHLVLDVGNRERVMRQYRDKDWLERDGQVMLHERRFDFLTGRNHETLTVVERDGARHVTGFVVRMYSLAELAAMFQDAGLRVERVWGDFDGSDLTLDSRRCIVLARKPVERPAAG